MKKLIMMFVIVLLLTGCSVKYEIEIVDRKIKETTSVVSSSSLSNKYVEGNTDGSEDNSELITYKQYLDIVYKEDSYALNDSDELKYKKTLINNNENIGIKYNYLYNLKNYQKSSNANMCYKYVKFYESGELYILSTDKVFNCFLNGDLDNVSIHLKTNHKVKENNADRVDGYNYYWNVDKSNYENKSIYIELYKDKYVFNYENKWGKIGIAILSIAILIISVFCLLFFCLPLRDFSLTG